MIDSLLTIGCIGAFLGFGYALWDAFRPPAHEWTLGPREDSDITDWLSSWRRNDAEL